MARIPKSHNTSEVAFLDLGDGARLWLSEAAAAGSTKIRVKMAQAVTLAKLFNPKDVDWALGHAAVHARFAEADLASILDHHHTRTADANGTTHRAGEERSLPRAPAAGPPSAPTPTRSPATTANQRRRCERDAPDQDHVDPDPRGAERTAAARGPPTAAAPAAAAAHPRTRPRGHRHREVPTLGTGRGPARPVRPRGRRAGTLRPGHPPRRGRVPHRETFEAWSAEASSIPAPTQQALRTLEWVHRRENLVVCGPSGTGKTFLLEALGQHAVEHGLKVAWFTLEDLGILLRRHRADDTVTKAIARVLRADLILVDDIGLLPVAADAAEGLYRLVDAAYEKRSVALSSNLHPAAFDELMPKTLATATVDRLLHHAHVCQTTGESVRLSQALAGQGVSPLA